VRISRILLRNAMAAAAVKKIYTPNLSWNKELKWLLFLFVNLIILLIG
jgi:hypothetical protein